MKVEPGNILKLFLNFSNFEPQYSYRLYSYKKKRVYLCQLMDSLGGLLDIKRRTSFYMNFTSKQLSNLAVNKAV